jgi:hypothetical protein
MRYTIRALLVIVSLVAMFMVLWSQLNTVTLELKNESSSRIEATVIQAGNHHIYNRSVVKVDRGRSEVSNRSRLSALNGYESSTRTRTQPSAVLVLDRHAFRVRVPFY